MAISFKDTDLERVYDAMGTDRLSPSLMAKRDLERYRALITQAEREIRFTAAELNLIYDACNGTIFDAYSADPGITHNVQDAIIDSALDKKWKVTGEAVVDALRELTPLQSWALVERIERYWADK